MKTFKGFTLEMVDNECYISKGKYHGTLNFVAQMGEIHDDYCEDTMPVPQDVEAYAELWEKQNEV